MKEKKIKSIIESLLFAKGKSVSVVELSKIIGVSKEEIGNVLENLEREYDIKNSGLTIIQKNDRIQMVTNPENSEFVSKMLKKYVNAKLSRVALETLSIIAYRGPVTKIEIEAIRGVNSSFVLRNLLLRGLIIKKKNSQKSYLYEISFEFLRKLGIKKIEELPNYEKLSKDERIKTIVDTHAKREK